MGSIGDSRVCPECISERRFIGQETLFPFVTACVVHRVRFVSDCRCGRPLRPFAGGAPFTCESCAADWGTLPTEPLHRLDDLRQRRIVHTYRVILEGGDSNILAAAQRVLDPTVRRWRHGWVAEVDEIERRVVPARYIRSLPALVANLVAQQIPPERLFETVVDGPHPDLRCRNRARPTFDTSVAVRISAQRSNGVESYCSECGSRYLGDRMILSFDFDHGCPELPLEVVRRARARLPAYHARLARASDLLADSRSPQPVHIDHVFFVANVPRSSHLRARRLGLVDTVRSHLRSDRRGLSQAAARPRASGATDDAEVGHARHALG